MAQEPQQNEYTDDRDQKHYGLPSQNNVKFDKSVIWIPVVIGISVAAGILTTRGIQRLSRGVPTASKSKTATSSASGSASSSSSSFASQSVELPPEAETTFSGKTFTGFLPYSGNFKEPMDIKEAALILGCRETAAKEVINKRFNTLMKCNHPDKGGSPFVATKINEAKTVLTKGKV